MAEFKGKTEIRKHEDWQKAKTQTTHSCKKSDRAKVKYCIYDLKSHSDREKGMKDKLLQEDRNKNH